MARFPFKSEACLASTRNICSKEAPTRSSRRDGGNIPTVLFYCCMQVEIDGWAEITVQRLPSVPLSKQSAMAMPTVMEMLLRFAVEIEVVGIVVLVEGVLALNNLRKQGLLNCRFTEILTLRLEGGGTAKRADFCCSLVLPVGSAGSYSPAPTL